MKRPVIAPLLALAIWGGSCTDSLPPLPSGALMWSVPGSSAGTPATDQSRVYFLGRHNQVIAVDKRTGARRWEAPTGSGGGTFGRLVRIAGGLVVAGDFDLVAFDPATGAGRWKFQPPEGQGAGLYDFSTDGTRIFAGSTTGHVYALDLTGKPVWTTNLRDSVDAAAYGAVLHEGLVYVCFRRFQEPSTGGIVALAAATGQVAWRVEFPPSGNNHVGCFGSAVISGDVVVAATQNGFIHAYDHRTGAHRWCAPQVSGLSEPVMGNPLMDARPLAAGAGVIVAGSNTSWVLGYDATTGEELWRVSSRGGSVFFPLATDHEAVYVTGSGDELSAYDLRTGQLRFRLRTHHDDPFSPRPLAEGERIFIGTTEKLMALRR